MNTLASAARVVHVLLLALGIGAAAQLLTLSDALRMAGLQAGAEVESAARAQLDGFMMLAAPGLLITLAVGWVPLQVRLLNRVIGVAIWTILAGLSARWLSPQLVTVREGLGRALDGLPPGAPGTGDWVQLTTASQAVLAAQLAVGVILLWWSVAASGPRRSYSGIQL